MTAKITLTRTPARKRTTTKAATRSPRFKRLSMTPPPERLTVKQRKNLRRLESLIKDRGLKILVWDVETVPNIVVSFQTRDVYISDGAVLEPGGLALIQWGWLGEDRVYYADRQTDGLRAMLEMFAADYNRADAVVTFNGKAFDDGWVETENQNGNLPRLAPVEHIDLYQQVAKKAKRHHKNLDTILGDLLGLHKEHHVGLPMWIGVMFGVKRDWADMIKYGCVDVARTGQLAWTLLLMGRLKHFLCLAENPHAPYCPGCGSDDLREDGVYRTATREYPRFQCEACGDWGRYNTYRETNKMTKRLK